MNTLDLYNYDEFVPEKFERWMRFEYSPELGEKVENFNLWDLEGNNTTLDSILNKFQFTVVEFGSFT